MDSSHKTTIKYLIFILLIFFVVFVLSVSCLISGTQLINLGLGFENWILIIFSLLAMMKVVFDIIATERSSSGRFRTVS